ncbi:EpsG family protein [Dysgonomonas sp. 25]|uniref:EpsG family protein n=1 Tax=Dysgonomonas sp. 25 TaxID=2302933 RepID=UPI0013D33DCD|nr:EpsG family protein [Dysgonomonas sp. 25]NDV67938.1 EpsG family protein [Dysgonomonas sp. 25]
MIDYIPTHIYTDVFNFLVFALVIYAVLQSFSGNLFKPETRVTNNVIGYVVIVFVILYMGLRPVSSVFGDTVNYAESFYRLQMDTSHFRILGDGEWVFNTIMFWFAKYSDIHLFFLFCAAIYTGTLYWAFKRIFKEDFFIPFIIAMAMFTFWSYGVNGIRNGMAASIIILALTFRKNIIVMLLLAALSVGIHKSMYLIIAAAGLAYFLKDAKIYLAIWIGSILVSLIAGNTVANFIAGSGLFGDDRFASYIEGNNTRSVFSHTGFRWDFLLYSAVPVVTGSYFVLKKEYTDKFYIWLFNIYLMTNAFWIIVIRASFSNRFAQISWFLIPLILAYPFFMKKFWDNQQMKIGYMVIIAYLYTFYLVFIAR